MNWRWALLLVSVSLGLSALIARFEAVPGYLDSDYYFAGGVQLALGRGFTEPYLWNYLDDPPGLPHPSHTYWMPLASIVAAGGMWLAGQATYAAGRLGFILLATLVPFCVYTLSLSFSQRRDLALVSGLLAIFNVYYAPSVAVPDNYALYMLLGVAYLLVMRWQRDWSYALLGIIAGLLTLARSDGILWLGLTFFLIIRRVILIPMAPGDRVSSFLSASTAGAPRFGRALGHGLLAIAGFLVIAGPWFLRTYSIFGTILAPGGGHLLWLTNYDQTFSYPVSDLTFASWTRQGLSAILASRLLALRWNLLNAFAAQGGIFLFPFILVGIWQYRRDERVRLAALAWLTLLATMTLVFPFAGYRGGFFHAGAALQGLWWALAPLGLDQLVTLARSRGMFTPAASRVFQSALVGLAVVMTAVVIVVRVLPGWGREELAYPRVQASLQQAGLLPGDVVMAPNPPGYYLMTGQPAIVVPYSDADNMWAAASRYHAKYLIMEAGGVAGPMRSVYDDVQSPRFEYLGEIDGTRLFRVQP